MGDPCVALTCAWSAAADNVLDEARYCLARGYGELLAARDRLAAE